MKKTLLTAAIAVAAGLAGCATGPYDAYGYGPTYDPNYYNGYAPEYYGPSVGFGYYYYDGDGHRHWRDRGDGNDRRWDRDNGARREWRERQDNPAFRDRGGFGGGGGYNGGFNQDAHGG